MGHRTLLRCSAYLSAASSTDSVDLMASSSASVPRPDLIALQNSSPRFPARIDLSPSSILASLSGHHMHRSICGAVTLVTAPPTTRPSVSLMWPKRSMSIQKMPVPLSCGNNRGGDRPIDVNLWGRLEPQAGIVVGRTCQTTPRKWQTPPPRTKTCQTA